MAPNVGEGSIARKTTTKPGPYSSLPSRHQYSWLSSRHVWKQMLEADALRSLARGHEEGQELSSTGVDSVRALRSHFSPQITS